MTFEEMCERMTSWEFTLWRAKAKQDLADAEHARMHAQSVAKMKG